MDRLGTQAFFNSWYSEEALGSEGVGLGLVRGSWEWM